MHFLSLPDDVLEKILSYISYDEVSRSRMVCQRFNEISKKVLNHGFLKVERYHTQCLKQVKSQLPRRESERRIHPLARHCDILTAVETRMSLLGMTFKKFIDLNLCCFIPGKVLDEIYKVLQYVTAEQMPVRAHEVLQELRDLSSMAMEHFEDKVAPDLKKQNGIGLRLYIQSLKSLATHGTSDPSYLPKDSRLCIMAQFLNKLTKKHNKLAAEMVTIQVNKEERENMNKRLADLEQFAADAKKKLAETEKFISEQQLIITNQTAQIKEQDLKLEKLKHLTEANCTLRNSKRLQHSIAVDRIKSNHHSPRSSKRIVSADWNKKRGCASKKPRNK